MAKRVVIVSANWLGDSVMSMPAVRAFRAAWPAVRVAVMTRPNLAPLWRMQGAVDDVIEYRATGAGTCDAARRLRTCEFDEAYVFPNSFRVALIVRLAGIPGRIGARGHWRGWLLTRIVDGAPQAGLRHQAWEYFRILGTEPGIGVRGGAALTIPDGAAAKAQSQLTDLGGRDFVGMLPGAARGPSKRWPAESFAEVGRRLAETAGARILVLGAPGEEAVCERVAQGIGAAATNLCGRTSLPELAALFSLCRLVVANDSGGMHLAAATGTPVVAIFGATDPARTGPLGAESEVLAAAGVERSRDIARKSESAADALRRIEPHAAVAAALRVWNRSPSLR
jgi:heptosyltransferase II